MKTLMPHRALGLLATLLALLPGAWAAPTLAQDADDPSEQLIALAVAHPPFDTWLPQHAEWFANVYDDDGDGVWTVEFHTPEWEEWLGYVNIDLATQEVVEAFAPTPLPDELYDVQRDLVLDAALHDVEVLAWLDNRPSQWAVYDYYNRWERAWELTFSYGLRAVRVQLAVDEDDSSVSIWNVYDAHQMDEQQAQRHTRDSAIQLAYSADSIWAVLDGAAWSTYVARLHDDVWGVSFVVDAQTRVFVLVDLAAEQVLDVDLR